MAPPLRTHWGKCLAGGNRQTVANRQPMDFCPSMVSRRMSAWPACCAVSARMCVKTRRALHDAPGSNLGASGSGCSASRSTLCTSASVAAATSSYPASRPARLSPSSIRKPSVYCCTSGGGFAQSTLAQSMPADGAGPSTTKLAHCCSTAATCLTSPPRLRLLTVGAGRAEAAEGRPLIEDLVYARSLGHDMARLVPRSDGFRLRRGDLWCTRVENPGDLNMRRLVRFMPAAVPTARPTAASCRQPATLPADGQEGRLPGREPPAWIALTGACGASAADGGELGAKSPPGR